MTGEKRRTELLNKLKSSQKNISGSSLAKDFNVSRQVIVQDIALLRAAGNEIISTNRGYMLVSEKNKFRRVFKVNHSPNESLEELQIFVDNGALVKDIFIYHRIYGLIKAPLNLSSRLSITNYLETIKDGQSTLLSCATSGYHYHTIEADDSSILDLIEKELKEKNFLASLTDHEPEEMDIN